MAVLSSNPAVLQAMQETTTDPAERIAIGLDLASRPAVPAPPAEEITLPAELMLDAVLGPIAEQQRVALEQLQGNKDISEDKRARDLAALLEGRAQALEQLNLPATFQQRAAAFLAAHQLTPRAPSPERREALEGINHAISHWLAPDALDLMEYSLRVMPELAEDLRPTLRRLTERPLPGWKDDEGVMRRAHRLLNATPRSGREVALARYKQAEAVVAQAREEWKTGVERFLRVKPSHGR